jgi:hypothetical protein
MTVVNDQLKFSVDGFHAVSISQDEILNLLGAIKKPKIDIIREKVMANYDVFYQMDVPAFLHLENVWYNRKHAIKVTPENWEVYKNGSIDNFMF